MTIEKDDSPSMTQEVKLKRAQCSYQPENARFLLECDFSKQYNRYYSKRLERTRPFVEFNCRSIWDASIPIYSLSEVASSKTAESIIIGTIFKRMKLQPDVIQELSKGNFHVKCERYLGQYTSQDDTLVLEDSEESIQLVGNINPKEFVTGIVVALLGAPIDDGSQFLVFDVCFAEPNRQILDAASASLPPELTARDSRPLYLMVISSLGFHHAMSTNSKLTNALQNVIDFVWGGNRFKDDSRSSRVARVLVLGNSLHGDRYASLEDDDSANGDEIAVKMKKSRQMKPYSESVRAIEHMDDFFAQLSKTIDVDVMPGPSDPSTHLMPQQPFHPCMFPKSCQFSTFNCVTNPQHAIYNDTVNVLATSGQNIDIISKFSEIDDPLDVMESHLRWGSSAPSAPDNLFSVPYEEDDPFIIDFIPDIYIAGNQKTYSTRNHCYTSGSQKASRNRQGLGVTPDITRAETPKSKISSAECTTPVVCGGRRQTLDDFPDGTPRVAGGSGFSSRDASQVSESESLTNKTRTLLVTIPIFHETYSCVLIDLNSLKSELLSFQ